jgi:hypothetical protein
MHGSTLLPGFLNTPQINTKPQTNLISSKSENTRLATLIPRMTSFHNRGAALSLNPWSSPRPSSATDRLQAVTSLRPKPLTNTVRTAAKCTDLDLDSNCELHTLGPHNLIRTLRGDLVLKPLPNKGVARSIIFLPGAETQPEQYLALAQKLQSASPDSLWVGIAKYDMPVADLNILGVSLPLVSLEGYTNPIAVSREAKHVMQSLKDAGMKDTKPFLVGHSLGGAFLHHVANEDADQYAGLIHLASFMPRGLEEQHPARQLPTLTISGDQDGLVDIMRIAEAYHRNVDRADDPLENPVVIIEGANHGSFFEGPTPPFVVMHDLTPEIEHDIVQKQVADTITQFIERQTGGDNADANQKLLSKVQDSGGLLRPLIDALMLEGNYHIKYPCSMADKADPEDCWVGSPWVERVTPFITGADADGIEVVTRDEFNPSWIVNLPFLTQPGKPTFHHPKVSPSEPNASDKSRGPIIIETVSQAVYDPLDERIDAGITPNTAQRIRAKFPSRQAVQAAAGKEVAFDEHNNQNLASKINQMAIDWAISHASPKARKRYETRGIPLKAGEDYDVHTGPDWIWSNFEKRLTEDETGKPQYIIDAAVMRAPTKSQVSKFPFMPASVTAKVDELIGGKHFATLLSPAEAMRHVYQESLRPLSHINSARKMSAAQPENQTNKQADVNNYTG